MAAKKKKATATKKASSKKASSKKAAAKKASKKTASKKAAGKKSASKKTASKKTASKKASSKKTAAKKVAVKKTSATKKSSKSDTSGKEASSREATAAKEKTPDLQPAKTNHAQSTVETPEVVQSHASVKIPSHPAKQGFFAREIEQEQVSEPFEADEDTGAQVNFVSVKKRSESDIVKHVSEALDQMGLSSFQTDVKALRKLEQSKRFKELFGWDLPTELAAWLAPGLPEYGLCSWDVDNFDLDEVLELEEDEYVEFFQDIDQSLILFMGLIQVGQHASGNEIYFDIGAYGNGFVNVVALNNEELSDHIESTSLSLFALKMKADNLQQVAEDFDQMYKEGEGQDWLKEYGVSSREELGKSIDTTNNIIEDMRQRYKLEITPDLEHRYSTLLKRIEWIRELLIEEECEHFSEKISASPDFSVWKKERKLLKNSPQSLFYWMLAHFFFDNIKACKETLKIAKKSASSVLNGFAEVIDRLLTNPGHETFGNIKAAKVTRLKEAVAKHITKRHRE